MKVTLRRIVALLMILVLSVSFMLAVYAVETGGAIPEDQATSQPKTSPPRKAVTGPPATDPFPTESNTIQETLDESDNSEVTEDPNSANLDEPLPDMLMMSTGGDGITTVADAEIVGKPSAFATLFLLETIYIPSFDHVQSKKHLPLYSVYLKNQPGYENNYYVAYCIEPGVVQSTEVNYDGNSSTLGELSEDATIYTYLSPAEIRAMGVALLYGQMEVARRADPEEVRLEKLRRWAATQVIIWEIAAGWRSAIPPYVCTDDTLYNAIKPKLEIQSAVWGTTFYLENITSAYDDIEAKMAKHYTIPSFASDQKSMAPIYTMSSDDSGGYSITLTDTNNILSEYTFKNTDNITYSVNGNNLTVTVKGDVTTDIVVSTNKNVSNLDTQVFWVWEKGVNQRMMSLKTEPTNDPVPCYFKLKINSTANLDLIKSTEDGENLEGWKFSIYSDAACTKLVSGPHTTDANGKISVSGVTAVTVYVKELGHTDSVINALYTCTSVNPQEVTLVSGQTATVKFQNDLAPGYGKIVKNTTNGGTVAGWHFEVKDASGQVIGTYVTDSTGNIALALEPGTYTVTETDGEKEYWEIDANPTKTVTVKAGQTAKVTFTNKWLGKAKVIKTTTNGGSVEGWTFTIKNSSGTFVGKYTTGADGLITVNLEPGTYTVQETPVDDPYWVCDTEVKTITVKAGETASVSFQNRYIGKAKIIKTLEDPTAGTVEGWTFEVKDSNGTAIGTYTTDANGTILCELAPGQYTVTEIMEDGSYWECVTDISQTVTVKAGQTAEVTFTNRLKPAEIIVFKIDPLGAPLAGAEFLLEWSEDGITWTPVTYTDSENVTKGTCTSVGLTDGKLESGRDGMVHFKGLHPELQYRLTETKAPEGYHLLAGPAYEGGITPDKTPIIELTVVNAPVYELPMTGSTSGTVVTILQIAGVVVLLIALLYIVKKRR